jgi:hypothetical protein
LLRPALRVCVLLLAASGFLPAPEASARPVNYVRTEVVSPIPSNPVASGTRLRRALADITGPSASDPWLIKIEPGIYDLDGASLVMRKYVDIEGSGEGVTIVQSTVNSIGTVQGAAHAELRFVTVLNFGATDGIALANSASGFTVSHVTCLARNGSNSSTALANFGSASGTYRDVTLRAEGSRVVTAASMRGGLLLRARAFASGDEFAYGLFNASSEGETIDLTVEASGAGYATAIRNEAGAPLLRNVRTSSRGATISEGIVNGGGSAARIQGAVIDVSGGTSFASGIRNEFSSALVSDAVITVDAPSSAFGVSSSFSGTPAFRNLTLRVTAGGHGVGVRSYGTQVTVESSTISTDGFSLVNEFGATTPTAIRVGASRLEGAVDPADGTLRCVATYDASFTLLGATCTP